MHETATRDPARSSHVVCTLAEGSYFLGTSALVNSLAKAGFCGDIVIGYCGSPPAWLEMLSPGNTPGTYVVGQQIQLRLVEIDRPWHLSNCKPAFMRSILLEICPDADIIYYFDSDIVITHPWATFVEWATYGVVLVQDLADSCMSPYHVYRQSWRELSARIGNECRDITGYFNGGCVGLQRSQMALIEVWDRLIHELERDGADMRLMKDPRRKLALARMDQDMLNAAVMATTVPLAVLGYEAMGIFPWVGEVMPHAVWGTKPWKRGYIFDALRGFPPGRVHNHYWKHANGPIRTFSGAAYFWKRAQLAIGNLIGLLHMRSLRDL